MAGSELRRSYIRALVVAGVLTSSGALAALPTLASYDGDTEPLGNRTPLILIHGIKLFTFQGDPAEVWLSFLESEWESNPDLAQSTKPYLFRYETVAEAMEPGDPATVDEVARALGELLEQRPEFMGKDFALLAHSMGGLVARSFMQDYRLLTGSRGGTRTLRLITLATPHHGSPLANLSFGWPEVFDEQPGSGFKLDLRWDHIDHNFFLPAVCNYWLGRLNINSGLPEFAGYCEYGYVAGQSGWHSKIFTYASTTSYGISPNLHFNLFTIPALDGNGYLNHDGIVPYESAEFSLAQVGGRRHVLYPCDHSEIYEGSCSAVDLAGGPTLPLFALVASDVLAGITEGQEPHIENVAPFVLEARPLPDTQLLTVTGSGFAPDATLTFHDGTTSYPGVLPIQPVSSSEVQYEIAVGPEEADWTVQVVNGSAASNAASFLVRADPGGDTVAPGPPLSPILTPAGWGNPVLFYLDWTNPPDETGISKVWWRWDSPPAHPSDGFGFSVPLFKPLPVNPVIEGARTLYVWLEDGAGNADHQSHVANTVYRDATGPTLTVQEDPGSGLPLELASATVALHGSASDSLSGVANVWWSSNQGGSGPAIGSTVWATPPILLIPGLNQLTIGASDGAGNVSTFALDVLADPPGGDCGPWEKPNGGNARGVVYGDGKFVAVGWNDVVKYSFDGLDWQQAPLVGTYYDVVWTGSEYLAVGHAGKVARSFNGIDWTAEALFEVHYKLNSVAWDGVQFVMVGQRWVSGIGYYSAIWTSFDGSNWVLRSPGTLGGSFVDVIWSGTQFVVVGSGGAWLSADGVNWTNYPDNGGVSSVAWGNGQYVGVKGGTSVYVSSDAQSWTEVPNAVPSGTLDRVRWAGTKFVAVGDDESILTSPDGITWTQENYTGHDYLYDTAWNGERSVAVGNHVWASGCNGRSLSVLLVGPGSGSVASSPPGIDCEPDCSEVYFFAELISLTAEAGAHSTFDGWSGDADCDDGEVAMPIDRQCEAAFGVASYSLTVTKAGAGSGTVTSNPPGIDCGTDCQAVFSYGSVVLLTPVSSEGSLFVNWTGNPDCEDGSLTVEGPVQCEANFALIDPGVFADGFESGDTSEWSYTVP